MYLSSLFFARSCRYTLATGLLFSFILTGCSLVGTRTYVQPYPGQHQPSPDVYPAQPRQNPVIPDQGLVRETFSSGELDIYSAQILQPALAKISGRIASYEQKLQAWQELKNGRSAQLFTAEQTESLLTCRNNVADLHEAYSRLQARLAREPSIEMSRTLLRGSLQDFKERDIVYLEGECPQLFTVLSAPVQQKETTPLNNSFISVQDTGQAVEALTDDDDNNVAEGDPAQSGRDFESDVTVTEEPPDSITQYRYGRALLKNGREQEADRVLSDLLAIVRRQGDRQLEIRILRTLADLEFGLREYAAARGRYQELQQLDGGSSVRQTLTALQSVGSHWEEVEAYASLQLGYLTYIPEKDGFTVVQQAREFTRLFPASVLNPNAAELAEKIEEEAEEWFSGLLSDADRLQAKAGRQDAWQVLDQVPLDILPLDKQEILRRKKDTLTGQAAQENTASAFDLSAVIPVEEKNNLPEEELVDTSVMVLNKPEEKKKTSSAPALQETWDKGMIAFQAEEYEQAITIFSSLDNTSFADEANRKIKKAARLAGQALRKKAARLFQRAGNATDPEARKKLLLSSGALLRDILHKYPQAGLEAKVQRNLSRVEQDLASIRDIQGSPE